MAKSGVLGIDEIANLLLTHGFPTQKGAEVGTAIVLCESAGKIKAVGVNPDGSRDRGIWQINSKWHPEVTDAMAFNPAVATTQAARISGMGTNFKAWSCYKSGAYKKHLAAAEKAVDRVRASITPGDVAGKVKDVVLTPLDVLADLVRALLSGETWIRVGMAIGGLILIFFGIRWIMRHGTEVTGIG